MGQKMAEQPLDLKLGCVAAEGEPHERTAGQLGSGQEIRDAVDMVAGVNDERSGGGQGRPATRFALTVESASGPGMRIESLHLESGTAAQSAAENEQIVAAAQAGQKPKRRHVARFEGKHYFRGAKRQFSLLDFELDGRGAEPAERGLLADLGKALLQPAESCIAFADVPLRAQRKPADHEQCDENKNDELWRHDGGARDRAGAREALYTAADMRTKRAPGRIEGGPMKLGWLERCREFLYGMVGFEFERQALELRGELESAFLLITVGDMLGVPVVPPLYSLRLLPYLVPHIATWKRRVMRERDLADKEEFHLHGV